MASIAADVGASNLGHLPVPPADTSGLKPPHAPRSRLISLFCQPQGKTPSQVQTVPGLKEPSIIR